MRYDFKIMFFTVRISKTWEVIILCILLRIININLKSVSRWWLLKILIRAKVFLNRLIFLNYLDKNLKEFFIFMEEVIPRTLTLLKAILGKNYVSSKYNTSEKWCHYQGVHNDWKPMFLAGTSVKLSHSNIGITLTIT